MSQWVWAWILLIASLIFFGMSAATRLSDPAAQDELCELGAADTLYETGVARDIYNDFIPVAYSPHLNLLSIHSSYSVFGQSIQTARLPGVLFALATLIVIFQIVRQRGGGDERKRIVIAAAACSLCASLPVFVQASTLIHIDSSMLAFFIVALVYSGQRFYEQPNRLRGFVFLMLLTGSLWARVTTPLIVLPILWVFAFRSEQRQVRWQLPLLMIGGISLFVGTWWLYCQVVEAPFAQPFTYTWEAFVNRAGGESSRLTLRALAVNVLQTTAWVGGVAMLLFALVGARRVFDFALERKYQREDLYFVCGAVVLLGYTVVGGTPFGFPKYHCPAFPLLSIAVGLAGTRVDWSTVRVRPTVVAGSFVASFLVQWVFCDDLVKRIRFDVRQAQAEGLVAPETVMRSAMVALGISISAWGIIFLLTHASGFKRRAAFALLPVAIGSGVGMVALQNLSRGATGYSYGSASALEVALKIEEILEVASREPLGTSQETDARNEGAAPEGGGSTELSTIAPSEVLYLIRDRNLEYVPNPLWTDRKALRARLEDPSNRAFVLSVPTNTVQQVRIVQEDREIKKILERDYEFSRIGTFHVWERKASD